jgi:hypothetical protein
MCRGKLSWPPRQSEKEKPHASYVFFGRTRGHGFERERRSASRRRIAANCIGHDHDGLDRRDEFLLPQAY